MKSSNKLDLHIFVCTNQPDNPKKCGGKGGKILRGALKSNLKDIYGDSVKVTASGCLGACERGINCIVYPEGLWFEKATVESAKEITEICQKLMGSSKKDRAPNQ